MSFIKRYYCVLYSEVSFIGVLYCVLILHVSVHPLVGTFKSAVTCAPHAMCDLTTFVCIYFCV